MRCKHVSTRCAAPDERVEDTHGGDLDRCVSFPRHLAPVDGWMDGWMGVPSTQLNAIQSLPPRPRTWRCTVLVWHVKRRLSSSAHLGREPASVHPASPPGQAPTWCGADGANGGEWGVVQGDQRSGQNPHARASSWHVPRGEQTEHVGCR